jgi:hypothetical protein
VFQTPFSIVGSAFEYCMEKVSGFHKGFQDILRSYPGNALDFEKQKTGIVQFSAQYRQNLLFRKT